MVKERKGKELPKGKPRGRVKRSSSTRSQRNIPEREQQTQEMLRQSKEQYRALFDRSLDCVFVHDFEGNFLDANETALKLLGYEREDIPHLNFASVLSQDQLPKAFATLQELKDTGAQKQVNEFRVRCKDGSFVDMEVIASVIYHNGKPHAIQGVGRDITAHKKAEEELKESEQKYRLLFETSTDCINQLDREGRYLAANPATAKSLGVPLEELVGKTMFEVMPKEVAQRRLRDVINVLDEWRPQIFEDESAGRYFHHIVIPLKTSDQKEAVQVITRDITERKQAEEALEKSEVRYRQLAENAGEAILVVQDDVIKFANPKGAELSGYSIEELVSRPFVKFIHPNDIDMVADRYAKRLKGEAVPQIYDFRIIRKDGDIRWSELNAVPISWEDQPAVLCFMSDITERKQAEEALRQSEERYRAILEKMEDSYSEVDLSGNITFINSAACRHLGYSREELIGMSYKSFTAEDYIKPIFQIFNAVYRTGVPNKGFHWKIIRKDGSNWLIDASASPLRNDKGEIIGFSAVGRDITERKKIEEQLMLTDRLASIGQLAAGMAHELNNPLTSVIGFSDLLLARDLTADVKEDLETINQEARRAINIVKGLITFAREQRTEKALVDINSIIQEVLQLRSYEQKVSNIEVDTRFAPALPQVIGNGAQLQQVFMNIIINAEQAMLEAHKRGKLTIVTEQVGDVVRASFTDDGPGISPDNMKQLFTPFFTTREVGKGTGLGLSICHGIVTEHGGKIYAESEPGEGATFVVELPISK